MNESPLTTASVIAAKLCPRSSPTWRTKHRWALHYNQSAFPTDYQGSLFVAYHGSWNSGDPRDCKVQRIVVQDGQPVESQAFVTGFRDNEAQPCGQRLGPSRWGSGRRQW